MENMLQRALNVEIAFELLKEVDANISEQKAEEIYDKCNGNPFNAPILYQLLNLANQ